MIVVNDDCLAAMKELPDNSVDSVITDPPYGLSFMGKDWDYDVPKVEVWEECLRVLKPGGHLLAFAGTRTQHRMAINIEDAGFEIRDMIAWVYGSGFPKSNSISKAIEKQMGVEPIGKKPAYGGIASKELIAKGWNNVNNALIMPPLQTEEAKEWDGWGTSLKPAIEPITVARKPLSEKTVAKNVLKWGTGGLNIGASRVGEEQFKADEGTHPSKGIYSDKKWAAPDRTGRYPANFIHDGSDVIAEDLGHASKFFYCAKASKTERNAGIEDLEERPMDTDGAGRNQAGFNSGDRKPMLPRANFHPTVKPIKLLKYLINLTTKEGGTVLDPYMGSGSTGVACKNLGRKFIGIELDKEYYNIAKQRIDKGVRE